MRFQKKSEQLIISLLQINLELKTAILQMRDHGSLKQRTVAFALIGKLKQEIFYFISENCGVFENQSAKIEPQNLLFYQAINRLRTQLFEQELIFDNQVELIAAYSKALNKLLMTVEKIESPNLKYA